MQEGYFNQKRKEPEVLEELIRRGYTTSEQKRVNEGLLNFTKSQKLVREMNAEGEWEYQVRPTA